MGSAARRLVAFYLILVQALAPALGHAHCGESLSGTEHRDSSDRSSPSGFHIHLWYFHFAFHAVLTPIHEADATDDDADRLECGCRSCGRNRPPLTHRSAETDDRSGADDRSIKTLANADRHGDDAFYFAADVRESLSTDRPTLKDIGEPSRSTVTRHVVVVLSTIPLGVTLRRFSTIASSDDDEARVARIARSFERR
jgi:hypothetical protein